MLRNGIFAGPALKYPKVLPPASQHGANPDLTLLGVAGDLRRRYGGTEAQLRLIAFLVEECGVNVNYSDDEGITPLAAASHEGHRHIVEYLLDKGADPYRDAPAWAKPLSLAEHRGHAGVAELLKQV